MEENTTPPLERRCPACGAAMPQEARFCGACGTESLPSADAPAEHPALADSATSAAAPTASAAPTPAAPAPAMPDAPSPVAAADPVSPPHAAVPAHGDDERICPWCDAVNPLDALRCVACDAVFPTPAGDEALERAARARIQSMESEINQRRAGWWPFRAR
jgi:ribosomal protein L40E